MLVDDARPRRLVLGAICLMTLSQFFHYEGTYDQLTGVGIVGAGGGDHVQADATTGMAIATAHDTINGVSGWSLHPHAWIVLVALAALFLFDVKLGKTWQVWGYWVSVAGFAFCLFPTDMTLAPPGFGFYAGLLAVLIAWRAAHLHGKISKEPLVKDSTHE